MTSSDKNSRQQPDSPPDKRHGGFRGSPESLKNLKRGNQPPERHVEMPSQAGEISAVVEDVSLFEDMRHVRRHPKAMDRTEGQKDARKWKEKDLKGFMTRFADLEKAAMIAKVEPQQPGSGGLFSTLKSAAFEGSGECPTCGRWVNDQGSERVKTLLRERIAGCEVEQARKDATLAAQPGAIALGRNRQEALKGALEKERRTIQKFRVLFDARWEELTQNEDIMGEMFIDWHMQCRARALELAVRSDPENVTDSLEYELKSTTEREQEWQKGIGELEGGATGNREVR